MEKELTLQVCASSKIRGNDCHGAGHYGAPRKFIKHKGIDFVCDDATLILSASDGIITRCEGRVYNELEKSLWCYVEVTDNDVTHLHLKVQCRYFYVKHWGLKKGQSIAKGDTLGVAQGIETLYDGITPHIHFETRLNRHTYFNPMDYLKGLDNEFLG